MIYAIVAVLVLIADQAVKYWTTKNILLNAVGADCVRLIDGVVHMTNVHNYGAAFGIMQNARWPLAIVSALFVAVVIVLINKEIIHTPFGRWTAVLVTAGALGNCIDRVLYGYVVDMFEVEFVNFAVFNVADIFITVCGILFCIHLIFHNEPEAVKEANAPEFIRKRRQEKREAAAQAAAAEAQKPAEVKAAPAPAPEEPETAVSWRFGEEVRAIAAQRAASRPETVPKPAEEPAKIQPAPVQEQKPAPVPEPAAKKKPGFEIEDFTLEDILAEFGDK